MYSAVISDLSFQIILIIIIIIGSGTCEHCATLASVYITILSCIIAHNVDLCIFH